MDPGNTYYAFMWNFSRLYARALTTFTPAPGTAGLKLVPNLATSLGTPNDGGKTWTYHIRAGLKFSDGTPITSADGKYAIERSNYAPDVLSNGPTYFHQYLVDNPTPYQGSPASASRSRTGAWTTTRTSSPAACASAR
jgi:peptide/nickel transport system substrate-binding protein